MICTPGSFVYSSAYTLWTPCVWKLRSKLWRMRNMFP